MNHAIMTYGESGGTAPHIITRMVARPRQPITSNGGMLQAAHPLPDREVGLRLRHSAERRVARRLQLQVSCRTRPVRHKDVKKAAGDSVTK